MEENEIPIPTITLEPSEEEILFNCLNDEGEFKKFVISNLIQTRKQISQLNFLFSEISSEMLEQILDRMDAHEFINYLKRESSSKSPEKLIENAIRNMNKYNFSQEKFEHFFKTLKQAIIIDQTMSIIFKLTTKEKFKKFLIEVAKFAVPDVVGKLIDEIIQLIR